MMMRLFARLNSEPAERAQSARSKTDGSWPPVKRHKSSSTPLAYKSPGTFFRWTNISLADIYLLNAPSICALVVLIEFFRRSHSQNSWALALFAASPVPNEILSLSADKMRSR
jgi:hypothetical protein